jgi:hypothetical protein
MSNECMNVLRIAVRNGGDTSQLKKLADDARTEESVFDLSKLAPNELTRRCWNAEGLSPLFVGGNYPSAIGYSFVSKNAPPWEAFEALSKRFPDLVFECEYEETNEGFYGKFIYCGALGLNQDIEWAEKSWFGSDDPEEMEEAKDYWDYWLYEDRQAPKPVFFNPADHEVFKDAMISLANSLKAKDEEIAALKAELAAKKD